LQQRALQRIDAADIGLRRASAHRKANGRARHVDGAIARDRAEGDKIVEFGPGQNRDIERRAVLDRAFQRGAQTKFDFDPSAVRTFELRHDFRHQRAHRATAEDFEV